MDAPFGQIGPVNRWNYTVSLTDMTFDNFEMNQAPVALGPGIYFFDVLDFTDLLIEKLRQRIRYRVGGIILPEHGTFDRNNAENRSRPVVIKPTLFVEGGGAGLSAHRDGITKPEHGVSGNQYPLRLLRHGGRAQRRSCVDHQVSRPGRCAVAAAPEYVMTRLTGRDLEDVMGLLRERKGGQEPVQVEIEAVLRHLHGGGDLLDLAEVEEKLGGDADVYAEWLVPFWETYPPTAADADGTTIKLAHPANGLPKTAAVRQLRGRDMDQALTNRTRITRDALMTGLEPEQVRRMDLADVLGLEAAAAPFLTRVLRALRPGGTSPAG